MDTDREVSEDLGEEWTRCAEHVEFILAKRGDKRKKAKANFKYFLLHKLGGRDERYRRLKEHWENRFAEEKWKSEEYARAERLEESLTAQENQNYALRMAILSLEAKLSGVNLEKAPPEHI